MPMILRSDGFTLIEITLVILLAAILSVASIEIFSGSLNDGKFQTTVRKMEQIRHAMIGDTDLRENGARTSFGYAGDIGGLPTSGQGLAALLTNPGLTAWAVNSSVNFGLGWNGPYLQGGSASADYTTDAWGNALVYDPTANPPTLTSYGADGAAGGTGLNQDIVVSLPATSWLAKTVTGYVTQHHAIYTSTVEVELNYPDGSGALTQSLYTVSPPGGYFSFSNVPFGTRSITAYIGTKAAPTQTIGPVLITIDQPNLFLPPGTLDTSP
jgi:prepilin-type N-terminal cleavage/methylation domain-containing protein